MNCGDAAGQIRIFYIIETGFLHKGGEAFLVGEFRDGVGKVFVSSAGTADGTADAGENAGEIEVECLTESGDDRRRKFKNHEFSARLENAVEFGQSVAEIRKISESEGDRYGVERIVGESEIHRVSLDKRNIGRFSGSDGEHRAAKIGAYDAGLGIGLKLDGEVAGAAGHVEHGRGRVIENGL